MSDVDRYAWTRGQAREYFEWLMNERNARVAGLLAFLGVKSEGAPLELLSRVGVKAARLLRTLQFGNRRSGRLTTQGSSLAADLGLLVAQLLEKAHPDKVYWSIATGKRNAHYNLPIMKGFGLAELDPVGGSIAEGEGVVRGTENGSVWAKIFADWSGMAGESTNRAPPAKSNRKPKPTAH